MNTNAMIQDLSETDCLNTEGGALTCQQLTIMAGAAIFGTIAAVAGTPGSAPLGGFLGGIAGSFAADLVCRR